MARFTSPFQSITPSPTAGQILKFTPLIYTDLNLISLSTATTSVMTNFITYSYTPVSASSYLVVDFTCRYEMPGNQNDSWYAQINIGGLEIGYTYQFANAMNDGSTGRSGSIFPLTGRYTNSTLTPKTIGIAARRELGNDPVIIAADVSMLMTITEIQR